MFFRIPARQVFPWDAGMARLPFQPRGFAAWVLGVAIFAASGQVPVQAIIYGLGRFDQMVADADVIAKFRVARFGEAPDEMISFSGTVLSVLKTDGQPVAPKQTFQAAAPIWPTDLGLVYAEGRTVLLILKRYDGALQIDGNMWAILPVVEGPVACAADASPERKMFLELQAYLNTVDSGQAQALILSLLGALGDGGDLDFFERQAESSDPWVRRGAHAAAAQIDPRPERVQLLVEDFEAHLDDPGEDHEFWEIYCDVRWASRCGAWGMEEPLTSRARAYLPVYRILVDRAPPGYGRLPMGIEGLKNVGTADDLPRLARYLDHETIWVRHDVLEGIGRILGFPCKRPMITSYGLPLPPEVESWERETRAELARRLAEQGVQR